MNWAYQLANFTHFNSIQFSMEQKSSKKKYLNLHSLANTAYGVEKRIIHTFESIYSVIFCFIIIIFNSYILLMFGKKIKYNCLIKNDFFPINFQPNWRCRSDMYLPKRIQGQKLPNTRGRRYER